ncbi:MAG: outer membrane beta-barrel protein [Crocinitomicaceae bacterium]|nr:outer membrane beta-barrel protein [Crocinitomicaceae bacterium]
MKKVVVLALLTMVFTPSFGQEEEEKAKIITFGFNAGINRSNLSFSSDRENGSDITNGLGYRFGLFTNVRLGKRFSFAPKVELSFNASQLDQDGVSYEVNPMNLEFIGHLKFKFFKSKFSPYIIAGPNVRIPINSGRTNFLPTKRDIAIDVGIGLDIPIFKLKIAPEIRYSFGLMDIMENSSISQVKYHNIALVLNFSGH